MLTFLTPEPCVVIPALGGLFSALCRLNFRSSSQSAPAEALCAVLSILSCLWVVALGFLFAPDGLCLPLDFPSKKRKRSRWNQDTMEQKTVIPGMPTVIPPGLTREQERAYIGKCTFCIRAHPQGVTVYSKCCCVCWKLEM